ncbi:MAG: baseplate J/gp47 family protein [Methanobrevibacter sp.]|jgi:hypothetical protein|nr:baseplate J/gp47 family protein [Methanobrevibacter sp.]
MAVEEETFTDIIGSDRTLSEIMDEIKEWVTDAQYVGLTNVDDWTEGAMNFFLLYISGRIKLDLEVYGDELIRLAFPDDSAGDFLDKLYARNGVFRIEGDYATTSVRFDLPTTLGFDAVLEAGTEVGTDEATTFNLVEDVIIPHGQTRAYGVVQCNEIGSIGNVLAGTIVNIFTDLSFEATVINEENVNNGHDGESDEDFKQRAKDLAIDNVATGTDLWVERVAKTLVDDAICYDLDYNLKLLVFKPTNQVTKQDLEELFTRKEYRTRNHIIIQEAESIAVIGTNKSINLVLQDDAVQETVLNIANTRIKNYVNKIALGGVFKIICIKYLCESIDKVLYANLNGFNNIDLTNNQYAIINGNLNITTEYRE